MILFKNIYRPEFSQTYENSLHFIAFLSCILYPFVAYVVLTKSPKVFGGYKWLIFATATCCFLFDIVLCALEPIFLLPFATIYSNGITSQFGSTFGFLHFEVTFFIYMNMNFCLLCCIIVRYIAAFPPTDVIFLFQPRYTKMALTAVYLLTIIPVWVLSLFSGVDPAILRVKLEKEVSNISESFLNNTYFYGYDSSVNPIGKGVVIATLLNSSLGSVSALMGLLQLYLIIKKHSSVFSETTRRLQFMLFKVIFLQIIAMLVFIMLPIATGAILLIVELNWAYSLYINALAFLMLEFHAFVDYCILLYFIKPYRRYCIFCLKRLFRKNNAVSVSTIF